MLLWLHLLNCLEKSLPPSIDTIDQGYSIMLLLPWLLLEQYFFVTKCLMIFFIIITLSQQTKDGLEYFVAVIWIGTRIIMLQHCVFKIKMAFEIDNFVWVLYNPALQIRINQWSSTTNLQPLIAHIYHVMIIVTSGFSKKCFYYNYFLEIILNNFINLFSWKLSTLTKHTEQFCFLFICLFFTCCFIIILCINTLYLFFFFCCV